MQGGARSAFPPQHPPAGIIIDAEEGGSRIVIRETGTVSSLNDLAIIDFDATINKKIDATMAVINAGTITGFVDLGGGDDTLINTGLWQVRHWADTDNDGIRDTNAVATSDFGAGTDTLNNQGTISLASIPGDNTPSHAVFDNIEVFNNTGILSTRNSIAGDSFTVNGNYSGSGQLQLDVDFATDTADTLTINGNVTSGTTTIAVTDVSSSTASSNDILVVDVTGTTASSDFSLAHPVIVVDGAYGYRYDLSLIGQTWYLQTDGQRELLDQTDGYRVLSALYDHSIGTLHQRVGHRESRFNGTGDDAWDGVDGWIRTVGKKDGISPDNEVGYEDDRYYVQAGVDAQVKESDKGRLLVGINAHTGHSNAKIDDEGGVKTSSMSSNFFGLGLTSTWYGHDELYLDLVGQTTWYNSDFSAERTEDSIDGTNRALSVEVGKRYSLNERVNLVPQAQFIWSKGDFDSFTDDDGVRVAAKDSDDATLRLGLMLEKPEGDNNSTIGYLRTNVYHRFSGAHRVNASGTELNYNPHDQWVEVDAGGSLALTENIALYGQLEAKSSLDDFRDSHSIGATIGIQAAF